jgi:hypothetical protein
VHCPGAVLFNRLPTAAVALGLALALTQAEARAQTYSNMKDRLIFHYCSKAMKADFSKAGKTPPAGMVDYTCNCVVQQVEARATIDQAKATCQARAQQKFAVQ